MKSILGVACIFLVSLSGAAQDSARPKVADADVKKLADAFGAMMDLNAKKPEQAQADFVKEFERIDKLVKPMSLLALHEVWTEVFYAQRTPVKAPSGLGRVEEKTIAGPAFDSKPTEFHYGLILPTGFDPKKRYPLIVALHDKAASRDDKIGGTRYLQEVWLDTKTLPKEERDKYIIMAPTMGSGAAGKEQRVEWGSILHVLSVYVPLKDLLQKYPIDNERIYLEGTGEGGEFAWHLALYKPHVWAAVAIRSALPKSPQLLQNGGSLPIAAKFRVGSPAQTNPGRGNLDHQIKTLTLPIEVKEFPAADKAARNAWASDTIPEATAEIVAFFSQKSRVLGPRKLTFVTDTPTFRECYWTKIMTHEPDRFVKITGSVDNKENAIDVQTEGIEEFKIYLNDRVVDLDRPVKVMVNGKPHTERLFTRDLKTLLNYYSTNADPALQPTAILEVKVSSLAETKPESPPAPK